ncbi:MAG: hypothetical protein AAF587_34995 [Bacteroidota bacterium]
MNHNTSLFFRFFLLLSIPFFSSCQTYLQLSDLQPHHKQELDLPPLAIEFEWENPNIEYSYQHPQEIELIIGSELDGGEIQYSSKEDVRLQDIRTLMRREIRQNISQASGPTHGTAVCRIIGKNSFRDLNVMMGISAIGMFVPSIFGLPLGRQNSEVALEIEILDNLGHSLGTYEGIGASSMIEGLYYGHQARRRTHILASKRALDLIQEQIKQDANRLNNALLDNMYH